LEVLGEAKRELQNVWLPSVRLALGKERIELPFCVSKPQISFSQYLAAKEKKYRLSHFERQKICRVSVARLQYPPPFYLFLLLGFFYI